jgi:hypothetical protein
MYKKVEANHRKQHQCRLKKILLILLWLFSTSGFGATANDKTTDYPVNGEYCILSDLKTKQCKRGSPLVISGRGIVKFCDLDEPIITYSKADNAYTVCTFSGYELIRKWNILKIKQ